ncbi:MAG: phosphate transport system permease protein [Solirubrobacterales bacterium]|nr:phosphate transport system permease protein [Solirubrobacterales bacterium]
MTLASRIGLRKAGPRNKKNRADQRAERLLGALACVVLALIAGMIIFVFQKAWPSFSHNGFDWFSPWAGGNVDDELNAIFHSSASNPVLTMHAWPLIWATAVITISAVIIATGMALLSAMFIVEFAPTGIRRLLEPVVRLLAAVPSVIYGLIGILVLVPWVDKTFVTDSAKQSVAGVISLNGSSIGVGILVLTVMITPIMIAIVVDALRSVPATWRDGAVALGVNRFRALWTVGVRAARPAIVAAGILATARALGEAIMLSMVTGSVAFAPNPIDGSIFFLEPARPLAATIIDNSEGLSVPPFAQTLYAFAAVLLVSAAFLSFAGWYVRRVLRRYTLSPI